MSQTIVANARHNRIFVEVAREPDIKADILANVPAAVDLKNGAVMLPGTIITARRLRRRYGNVLLGGPDAARIEEWLSRWELATRYRDGGDALPSVPGERAESWGHQRKGFWFGYHLPEVMLQQKVGAGKTKQAVDICCNRAHRKALVVTTASAVDDWPEHIAAHAWRPYHVHCLNSKANATRKAEQLREAFAAHEWYLCAVSYDTIWRPPLGCVISNARFAPQNLGVFGELPWDVILLDELHNLADPTARRSLYVWRLGERIPHRIGLSGTTIRHKPENVFGVYRALDAGLFGTDYKAFTERYCIFNREAEKAQAAKALNKRFIIGYNRLDEMGRLMSAITFDPGEIDLHLPKPIHVYKRCYLGHKSQRAYDDLSESFIAEVNGTEFKVDNVLVRMLRLQQVTSGFLAENIIDPESGEIEDTTYHDIGTEKADLLREVLEGFDADEPVVIACRFRHDIDIIRAVCAGLGRRVYEQSGRRKERVAWQEARGGEVLIGQIRSVCEAISLVRSRYAILYSLGHSLYQYVQFLGRLDRPGQTRQPCYIHLLAQRTIDEAIYRAFRRNQNFIDTINAVVRAGGRSLNTSLNTLLSGAAA